MAPKMRDLIGEKFNKLTVIKRIIETDKKKNSHSKWECLCDCGNITQVYGNLLKSGGTKSCGCLRIEKSFTHGLTNTKLYNVHQAMGDRCYNPNANAYKNYGGRGITICNEWLDKTNGFINFYNWSMENGYSETLTLDRINVNEGYSPDNCRWVTWEIQATNKRNSRNLLLDETGELIKEIASKLGTSTTTIYNRIDRGLDYDDITRPIERSPIKSGVKGITKSKWQSKWMLNLTIDGKRKYYGSFETIEEAVKKKEEVLKEYDELKQNTV